MPEKHPDKSTISGQEGRSNPHITPYFMAMLPFFSRNHTHQPLFKGKSAVICGGSKGIGRAIAQALVESEGSVCLIARNQAALDVAAAELRRSIAGNQFVSTIACDTTDFKRLRPALDVWVEAHGTPDYLVNVVGYAYPQYLQQLTFEDFRQNMEVNYLGQLAPILALLPHFLAAEKGHITNVSSILGYLGTMGYTAYVPTKYAIFGLSEALRNELKPHGIQVAVLFPSDTDTPGFEQENRTKPGELAIMSGNRAHVYPPEAVANSWVRGIRQGKFEILVGEARWMRLASRLSPRLTRYLIDREYRKAREVVASNNKDAH